MTNRIRLCALILSLPLLLPSTGFTQDARPATQQSNLPQEARQIEADVEDAVRRFGVGVSGGAGLDPELIVVGAHGTFGPLFRRGIEFRPGVELGIGEVTTMLGIDLNVLYRFPGTTTQTRWRPYIGGGPNFALSHRSFETEETDHVDGAEDRNRFDFSDTDFKGGFNLIAGARNRAGLFFELKATAWGVTNVRLLAGFNF
jgi:hypothetical protein